MDREWQPGAVRKLFDKEIDNHHEEPLLAAQLAAWQLRSLCASLQGPALAALKAALVAWLPEVMQVTSQVVVRLGITVHIHKLSTWA